MSDLHTMIPALLREKLGGGLGPEEIWGYQYTSGYWEEDDSWDCPIRDFIEEPVIQINVADDKDDTLIRIEKNNFNKNACTAFEDLHHWLKENFGKGINDKTDGIFGIVKQNGKYQIEFGQVINYNSRCFHSGMLIEKIAKLLPKGYDFIGKENDWKWQWEHHGDDGNTIVVCEILAGFNEEHLAYYHFDIWHETDNSLDNSSYQEKELDVTCCRIARMLIDEYPECMNISLLWHDMLI